MWRHGSFGCGVKQRRIGRAGLSGTVRARPFCQALTNLVAVVAPMFSSRFLFRLQEKSRVPAGTNCPVANPSMGVHKRSLAAASHQPRPLLSHPIPNFSVEHVALMMPRHALLGERLHFPSLSCRLCSETSTSPVAEIRYGCASKHL